MKSIKILICLFSLLTLFPIILSASVDNYEQLVQRESEAYLLHNIETVSFDGQIWTRQYGMKEYYVTASVKDIRSYMLNVRGDRGGTGGFELIKVTLNSKTRELLAKYNVNVSSAYPKANINVMLPIVYVEELRENGLAFQNLEYDHSNDNSAPASREDRIVIYEQGFEEPLDPQVYEMSGFIDQPNILYKNVCWGVVDCESYEDDQSIWCSGDIYGNGWYTQPIDPCTSYTNWVWTYFARLETIDVTVAEELVFEYYTNYSLDSQGWSDWLRVWVIDNDVTDWTMVGEYTGAFGWDAVDMEIEDYSNFSYYFEFESDDQEFASGIYIDNVSIYNMIPNLTWGEGSTAEYPYNYAPTEPHNLRVNYEVVNDSNVDVDDAFTTEILLSVDDDYTTVDDNYSLETINFATGLESEEMVSGEVVANLDLIDIPGIGNLPEGTYHVMFMVDNGEDIDEAFEDDNLWAPEGTFEYGVANLTPGAGSSFTYPAGTNTTTLEVVVEALNDGVDAVATAFEVEILLSSDNDITTTNDNYELEYLQFTNPIAAGAAETQTMILDLATTTVPVGDFWIFYVLDVYATVNESNEIDNTWSSNTQITYLSAPYLVIDPLALNFSYLSGSQTLDVSSNTDWVVSENEDWLSLDSAGGNGDGMVTVTVLENNIPTPRTANVIFNGAGELIYVTISQEAGIAIIYGDIDATYIVDAYDASLTLQYVVGLDTGIDPFPVINANVDGDGDVSAYDAGLILQFVVNMIDHFPVEDLSRK